MSSTPPAPAWLQAGRIPGLDGLRALAVVLVIFAHSGFPGDHLLPLRAARGRAGFLGVQVFFVLSGFLITTLMLREVRRTGRLHLGRFYLRRALRIVPVYTAYLLLVALLQAAGQVHLSAGRWLGALSYTVNLQPGPMPWPISHFWSLCVEEHFYLLWPLLVGLLPMAACRRAVPVCLAGVFLARWALLLLWPGAPVDLLTVTRIDDIAVGCGLAFVANDDVWRARLTRLTTSRLAMGLLLLGFLTAQVVCSRVVGGRLLAGGLLEFAVAAGNDVNAFTIAVLMWAVLARPGGRCGRLLEHPAVVTVGVLSYSAYLWHLPLCEKGPAWLAAFPQNLLPVFALAAASYALIERPFLSLKDRFGGEGRGAPTAAYARTALPSASRAAAGGAPSPGGSPGRPSGRRPTRRISASGN
jgi:peptidoglycan/LPS O-acetylase OafA/YrhL